LSEEVDLQAGWTAETVGQALVAEFRASPGRPLYGDKRWSRFVERAPRRRGPDPLLCLMIWARACGSPAAPSAAEFCRANSLPRPTFERRRRQAAAAIAAGLNRQGCRWTSETIAA
jgi:hypothetical protein